MVWPRKARLLLVSSQAKPPGSQAASQNSFMNASASLGALGVDRHLARFVDLHAAEAPHQRIDEGRGIAEGVAERLPDRQVLVLDRGADLEVVVPGVGHFEAQLVEHVLAVDGGIAEVEQRHAAGDPVDHGDVARPLVDLIAPELLHQRVVVGQTVGEQLGLIGVQLDHVGAAAALDRGGDPGRHVVLVDLLGGDRDPGRLRELRGLAVDLDVGVGDEAAPLQIVHLARLRVRGRLAAEEGRREQRAAGDRGRLDEPAAGT